MTIKMLIDASHEEETRVAIVHGNRVEEFDYESSAKKQIKGNIYLAKITRVEPSLQAAFVEYGGNRHGFLAFSEIHPDYYQIPVSDREALIAEEAAAYARILEEDEEIPEKKPKRKPRRKSKPRVAKTEKTTEDTSENSEENISEEGPEVAANEVEAVETVDIEVIEPEDEQNSPAEEDAESDGPSITKAENVAEPDTITEDVPPEDSPEDSDNDDDDIDSDIEKEAANALDDEEAAERLRVKIAKGLRRKYKIQEVIKKNQVMLIQVVKEERGNKGAALTTYLSLPGRYCVLMPNTLHGGGVSRKIASVSERKSLKKILADLNMPSGIACIIRTAGQSRTKTEIKRDFDYLIRTWEGIRERTLKSVAPVLINEEGDLIKRSIRDLYTREIDEILVEGEDGYKTARSFMRLLMPSHARKIKHYTDPIPLLHKYQVESQLDSMYSPTVQLKSGGYIVINPTEALVSIDVNSGKATKGHNIEETARKTNLEAAEEVARQLRLRDMAGLIVIDFIDMEVRSNNRAVEQKMKECLKSDRARIQVGKISSFGLLEMSRQRLRAGVLESSTRACPHCEGSGVIRSMETQVLHILRALEEEGIRGRNDKVTVYLPEQTAIYMLNGKRTKLVSLEEQYSFAIEVAIDTSLTEASYRLEMKNSDNKKPEKSHQARQNSPQNQQSGQNKDRSGNPRRNRQRNQNRKSRDHGEDKHQENEETPEVTAADSDNQDSKPRRRRRRPRRGNRNASDHSDQNSVESSENAPSAPVDSEVKETPSVTDTEDKPRRRSRGSKKPSDEAVSEEKTAEAPEVKADQKPARRPYPPQARSRRKASESKKADDKPAIADAAKPQTPETPKNTGPKKTGWWQRTFG
ncbi:Ribonuclease E [hydrothermal vent metagenome]|uniref:Ribonuclease G n=1 Tax=hydrothermal vent metagenome TaxID=652676 RepID=A0A3B0RY22_9ZZZZ